MALLATTWTWSATDKAAGSADSVLSNPQTPGYLTVTRNHNTVGNVNYPGRTNQKYTLNVGEWIEYYARVDAKPNGTDGVGIGFMNPISVIDSNGIGNGSDSCGLYGDGSTAWAGNAAISLGASFAVGDVMGCKLERTNSTTLVFSVNKNGGAWVMSAANVNQIRTNSTGEIHGAYTTYFDADAMTIQNVGGAAPSTSDDLSVLGVG